MAMDCPVLFQHQVVLCCIPGNHHRGGAGIGGVLIGRKPETAESFLFVAGFGFAKRQGAEGFEISRVGGEVLAEDGFGLFQILGLITADFEHGDLKASAFMTRIGVFGLHKALEGEGDGTTFLVGEAELVERLGVGGHVLGGDLEFEDGLAVLLCGEGFPALLHVGRLTRFGRAGAGNEQKRGDGEEAEAGSGSLDVNEGEHGVSARCSWSQ